MAAVTFMIGNGFDLACGIKSRYKDSYSGYVKRNPQSEVIKAFQETIERDIDSWSDFEMKLADYAKSFSSEKELSECIQDYSEYLNLYLENEAQLFLNAFRNDKDLSFAIRSDAAKSLYYFYDKLTPNDYQMIDAVLNDGFQRNYQFICFNYTTVFDEVTKAVFTQGDINHYSDIGSRNKGIVHIHGTLGNDLILGLDNTSQLQDIPYTLSKRGKRSIIKPLFLEEFDKKRVDDAVSFIESSNVICAFGLALGDSDFTWRKALAEWLLQNTNNQLVYYCHKLSQTKYPSIAWRRRMEDEEDYREELLKKLYNEEVSQDVLEQVRKQIHIPVGETIFDFDKARYAAIMHSLKKQEILNATMP